MEEGEVEKDRRIYLLVLLSILIAGIGVRLVAAGSRGIWYDDAFSIFLAERSLGEIIKGTAADTMPPLYYFLLHFWMEIGNSIVFIRLLNIILSGCIVAATAWLGKEVWNWKTGLWGAVFAALSPLQVYHAQEVRMYALLTLMLLLYTLTFVRIWKKNSADRRDWISWIGLVLSGTGAMYSHNLAVFSLIFPGAFLILRREWKLLLRWVGAMAVIALFAAPWLVLVPAQVEKIQTAFWTPRPGILEVVQALIILHTNLPLPTNWLAGAVVVSFFVLTIVILENVRKKPHTEVEEILLAGAGVTPVLLVIVSYMMRPVFVVRAFMLSGLIYYLYAGRVAAEGKRKAPGMIISSLLIVGSIIGLMYQYTYTSFPRSPFREAMESVQIAANDFGRNGQELRIIHDNKLSYFPSYFYARDLAQVFLGDEPGSHNDTYAQASQEAIGLIPVADIQNAAVDAQAVAFVVFTETITEYQEMGLTGHPVLDWLSENFNYLRMDRLGDLQIYYYVAKS